MNRLAQAYLFCGTRGVGKTSVARIFAKCLNCVQGPSEEPCQVCDICQAIAQGQDVDVIEIDGASNNGVEQVRELRQNAALRPSRARFKIYYIDEVHMLTTAAFNALLKTLEEPPAHVMFFFATTEPSKIPITVLSRCQRYDLAGITPELIGRALGEICVQEGVQADPEALQAVARRAEGSLRDAQSLLDRLLASGSTVLSLEAVHSLLGTPSDERLLSLMGALADHDPACALLLAQQTASAGVQPAELVSGLIDYARDAMVMAVGAETMLLATTPRQRPELEGIVKRWSVDEILAALQILSECRMRMRGSIHAQLLVELALVRSAQLARLTALAPLIERLRGWESGAGRGRSPESSASRQRPSMRAAGSESDASTAAAVVPPPLAPTALEASVAAGRDSKPMDEGPAPGAVARESAADRSTAASKPAAPKEAVEEPPAPAPQPAVAPADSAPAVLSAPPREDLPPLEPARAREVWPSLIRKVGGGLGWRLGQVEPLAVEGADVLVIAAKPGYNSVADACGTPAALQRIEQGLQRLLHRPVSVRYERSSAQGDPAAEQRQNEARRAEALLADPMIQKVVELFEARRFQVDFDESDD
jgi:DNA polymerase-3 subunit gamma/tau